MREELIRRLSVRGAQAQLARALSVAPTTVNNWANGRNIPEPELWPAIEAALGIEPGALVALAMPPGATDVLADLRDMVRSMASTVQRLEGRVAELEARDREAAAPGPPRRRAAKSTPR